jgi:FPC/CPF motif-containing protein YcgG
MQSEHSKCFIVIRFYRTVKKEVPGGHVFIHSDSLTRHHEYFLSLMNAITHPIIEEYLEFIRDKDFPCIAAKAALAENQIKIFVGDHIACPKDDAEILNFLYRFVDEYRAAEKTYYSAVIIFKQPGECSEEMFSDMLWKRLQSISDLDSVNYAWDKRVDKDGTSPAFSFSIKEEAFYVIGLHPQSSRKSRQFKFPSLVFNPHAQFEKLRASNKYTAMKDAVRKRDVKLSGSVNPMLADFGESSEAFQYSGLRYDSNWKCPFAAKHETSDNHSAS